MLGDRAFRESVRAKHPYGCRCEACLEHLPDDTEWQCTCGKWVPIGYSRHTHLYPKPLTLEQMHEMRRRDPTLQHVPDIDDVEIAHVLRTKDMPTR